MIKSFAASALALGLIAFTSSEASSQTVGQVRDALRGVVRSQGFGALIQGVGGFGALPGISAANFTVDGVGGQPDAEVSRINFAPSTMFDLPGVDGGPDLYVEIALGYLTADQTYRDLLPFPGFQGDADSEITSFSAIPGAGLVFPLTDELTVTPIALLGVARVDDSTTFSGANPGRLDRATRGLLFNYRVDELLYGGAVQVDYDTAFAGDLNLHADARYNQVWTSSLDASDPALEADGGFGVLTAHAEVDGPSGATMFGRELRWIGFAANSTFFGDAQDALGFDWFFELGGGIELVDRRVVSGVEGVSLRGSVVLGDGVTGWSLGAQIEF